MSTLRLHCWTVCVLRKPELKALPPSLHSSNIPWVTQSEKKHMMKRTAELQTDRNPGQLLKHVWTGRAETSLGLNETMPCLLMGWENWRSWNVHTMVWLCVCVCVVLVLNNSPEQTSLTCTTSLFFKWPKIQNIDIQGQATERLQGFSNWLILPCCCLLIA